MTFWFAARRFGEDAVGGIEAWSREVHRVLGAAGVVRDVAHRGPRWQEPGYLASLPARLRRVGPGDVVDGSDASLAIGLPRHPGTTVVRAHGLDLIHPGKAYQFLLSRRLDRVDGWIANSEATADLLRSRGLDAVTIVHPPALGSYRSGHGRGRLLMVGRLVRRKGFADFIDTTWPHLAAEGYTLDIIGDGPDRARLQQAVGRAPGELAWHGEVAGPVLERLWARADVLLMPNVHVAGDFEGFGMVAAESAVRGVPVVAADVDGTRDAVIDGVTGTLLAEGADSAAWVGAVAQWSGAAEARRAKVAEAATAAYGPERHAEQYLAALAAYGSGTRT